MVEAVMVESGRDDVVGGLIRGTEIETGDIT